MRRSEREIEPAVTLLRVGGGSGMQSAAETLPAGKPRVAVFQDPELVALRLVNLAREADCEVCEIFPHSHHEDIEDLAAPQLAVVGLGSGDGTVDRIREIRELRPFSNVPILAVARPQDRLPDRALLESLGVTGLVDPAADRDHLVFRIGQLARDLTERRSHQRVNCLLPVSVAAAGEVSREVALSLSIAGAGLASTRELNPNMDVRLEFLTGPLSIAGHLEGRVARATELPNSVPRYRVGVVFYTLPRGVRSALAAVIESLREPRGA